MGRNLLVNRGKHPLHDCRHQVISGRVEVLIVEQGDLRVLEIAVLCVLDLEHRFLRRVTVQKTPHVNRRMEEARVIEGMLVHAFALLRFDAVRHNGDVVHHDYRDTRVAKLQTTPDLPA